MSASNPPPDSEWQSRDCPPVLREKLGVVMALAGAVPFVASFWTSLPTWPFVALTVLGVWIITHPRKLTCPECGGPLGEVGASVPREYDCPACRIRWKTAFDR